MKCRVSIYRICVKIGSEALLGGPFGAFVAFKEEDKYVEAFPRDLLLQISEIK